MTFSYQTEQQSNLEIIHLAGELIDKTQASELSTKVDEYISENKTKIIFDLKELKYINSSGLNIMINILSRVRKAGGEIVITNVSRRVNELLIITKLNTVFTVTESLELALSKFK
jgi:anti-sigma B factor antagonist